MDLELIQSRLKKFAVDRDWEQFHNPKNLAMSISIEAAELMEIFQWSSPKLCFSSIADPNSKPTTKAHENFTRIWRHHSAMRCTGHPEAKQRHRGSETEKEDS